MQARSVQTHAIRIRLLAAIFALGVIGVTPVAGQTSREEKVSAMMAIVRSPEKHSQDEVAEAIDNLGQLRAAEAVNDLVRLLSFRRTFWWEASKSDAIQEIRPVTRSGRYPAVGALFSIGEPALPSLTRVIEKEPGNSLRAANALEAIGLIFREKPNDAVRHLREAASKAKGTSASRLSAAAAKLERGHLHR